MAEKKIHKRLVERLKKYEAWEAKASQFLIDNQHKSGTDIPEKALETARSIMKKEYLKKPGIICAYYLTYLKYIKETPNEERKTLESLSKKYLLYYEAEVKVPEYRGRKLSAEELFKKEALLIMAARHKDGEERYSDLYNSKMLLEDSGENILYCAPWKTWLLWDGSRWKKDEENRIYQLAIDSIKGIYEKALKDRTEEEALTLMEHAGRSETSRKIDAMVRVTSWSKSVRIHPDELDTNDLLFNCRNGFLDLSCGRLYDHDRGKRITKLSPVPYDQEAQCPEWIKFLKAVFKKNREMIAFVQKILGMSLTGDISAQAMFILYGVGANGKSTFINTVMKLMGDYGASTPTETFMQKKGDTANNDIARLKGTRFVSAMEADYGGKLAEAVIKRLTGNDAISARFLYGEFFEFTPTFKIFMATNHKPKIGGMDNAIWRRIRLIPFEVSFTEKQQDPKLGRKLEAELPGILAWMVEGCLTWLKEGLGNPPAVADATNEYRYEMSAVETFLQECCLKNEQTMTKSSHLYGAYSKWCEENNEHIMSARAFGMRLAETGLDKVRLSAGYHWIGIGIREYQK